MKVFALFTLMLLMGGCSSYGTAFDCPMPKNAFSCESISKTAAKVEKKIAAQSDNQTIIYVKHN